MNRFKKSIGASGCYKCVSCGKLTRETGEEESARELCAACDRIGLLEAEHDYGEHKERKEDCPLCKFEAKQTA